MDGQVHDIPKRIGPTPPGVTAIFVFRMKGKIQDTPFPFGVYIVLIIFGGIHT